jgi:hypothetical protein
MTVSGIDQQRGEGVSMVSESGFSRHDQTSGHSGFSPGAVVVVEELSDGSDWAVRKAFSYKGKTEVFNVEEGMMTDFASVPRVFVWFLQRYGAYTLAAILHDHLWRDLATNGKMEFIDADATFRRAMRQLGVPFLTRWMMWSAVRWGALLKRGGRRGWVLESWRVLLFTAIAAPFVLPPALLIFIVLLLFHLTELVVWVPLRIARAVKLRAGKEAKTVNLPSFDWRLASKQSSKHGCSP